VGVVVKPMPIPLLVFFAPLENIPLMMEVVKHVLSLNTLHLLVRVNVIHVVQDQRLLIKQVVNYAHQEQHQVMMDYVKHALLVNTPPLLVPLLVSIVDVVKKPLQIQLIVYYAPLDPLLQRMELVNSALKEVIHPMQGHVYVYHVEQEQVQTVQELDVIYVLQVLIPLALVLVKPAPLANIPLTMVLSPVLIVVVVKNHLPMLQDVISVQQDPIRMEVVLVNNAQHPLIQQMMEHVHVKPVRQVIK